MNTEKKLPEQGTEDFENQKTEELIEQLEKLTDDLEQGTHSLEETFAIYRRGLRIAEALNQKIDRIEKQMEILETAGADQ